MLIIMITLQIISILDRAVELVHRFYQGQKQRKGQYGNAQQYRYTLMDCSSFWFVGSAQRNSHKYGYQS